MSTKTILSSKRTAGVCFVLICSAVAFIVAYETVIDPPLTVAGMSGNYKGRYRDGIEVLLLREDGTFVQRFEEHGRVVCESSGRWHTLGHYIEFEHFIGPVLKDDDNNGEFDHFTSFSCRVLFGGKAIIISTEDYVVHKVTSQ